MEKELLGCWHEAERADRMVVWLERIRAYIAPDHSDAITDVLNQINFTSLLLRDLYDLIPLYNDRIRLLVPDLKVVLPSLQKTLCDMKYFIQDPNPALTWHTKWEILFNTLNTESKIQLGAQFALYEDFLVHLIRLLSRPLLFDPVALEMLRVRILRLRIVRGIPVPRDQITAGPASATLALMQSRGDDEREHWAEHIFGPQQYATPIRHNRRPFDNNSVSVSAHTGPHDPTRVRFFCRWVDNARAPAWSSYGVHELCIRRRGSSLQLTRWSQTGMQAKLWLALFFRTWEKMVLFHCTCVALKARCDLTRRMKSEEYVLAGENLLFRGQIRDDGYDHALEVYQDRSCDGLRLHAAVWQGELKRCPIWTAFITHSSSSTKWLRRSGHSKVRLRELKLYVFCDAYNHHQQRRRNGEFVLQFIKPEAAQRFVELFKEPPDSASAGSSEMDLAETGPMASGALLSDSA